jgi:hypothetical protein
MLLSSVMNHLYMIHYTTHRGAIAIALKERRGRDPSGKKPTVAGNTLSSPATVER